MDTRWSNVYHCLAMWMRKRDAGLERGLASDLALEEEELQARGLSPEQARAAGRRTLGNTLLNSEHTHEAWGAAPWERLWQDGVFAYWTSGTVRDPAMLAAVAGILFLAAVAASAGPAWTATSINPMQALRAE